MTQPENTIGGPIPRPSRLYTFIDEPREFALFFLEGQRFVHDLALIHPVSGPGFAYFRDTVLSVQPMVAFLKHGEQFGFYVDSKEPFFRLKIETAHHGQTRCMLIPDDFRQFPEAMHGLVRVQKLFPNNKAPYESIVEAKGLALKEIINHVLRESFQTNSAVIVSDKADQSVLLHQLPLLPNAPDEYDFSMKRVRERRDGLLEKVEPIFARALQEPEDIGPAFADIGFRYLAVREVAFQCSCSRERMIQNLRPIYQREGEKLFEPDSDTLEVVCEYCKKRYPISRTDLRGSADPLN